MAQVIEELEGQRRKVSREAAIEQWAALLERNRREPSAAPGETPPPVVADAASLSRTSDRLAERSDLLQARGQSLREQAAAARDAARSLDGRAATESEQAEQDRLAGEMAEMQAETADQDRIWQAQLAESQAREAELAQVRADRREAEAEVWRSQAQTLLLSGGTREQLEEGVYLLGLVDAGRGEVANIRREVASLNQSGQAHQQASHNSARQFADLTSRKLSLDTSAQRHLAAAEQARHGSESESARAEQLDLQAAEVAEAAGEASGQAQITARLAEETQGGFLLLR